MVYADACLSTVALSIPATMSLHPRSHRKDATTPPSQGSALFYGPELRAVLLYAGLARTQAGFTQSRVADVSPFALGPHPPNAKGCILSLFN